MEEHVVEKNEGFDNTRFELMGEWELKNLLFTYGGDDSNAPHGELVERVRVLWLERNGKPRGPPPANLFRRSPWQGEDPPVQRVFRSRGAYEGTSPSRSRSRSRDRSPCRRRHDDDDPLVAATTSLSLQDTARKAARRAESTKRLNKTVDSFLSEATVSSKHLVNVLCRYVKQEFPEFMFTSITLNKNFAAKKHRDSNNLGDSRLIALGDFTGGNLLVEEKGKILSSQPARKFRSKMMHSVPFTCSRKNSDADG